MTSKRTPPALRPKDFRAAIVQAELDGVAKAQMTLRLTLRDESELKRDRSIPVEEISFIDGEMRFLGVKVTPGGVAVSTLDLGS
jgi:hypothetical protein